jgi:hypothetical protein
MGKHARIGLLLGASACLLAAMVDWVIDELNEHGNPSAGKLASPLTPVPGRSPPLRGRAGLSASCRAEALARDTDGIHPDEVLRFARYPRLEADVGDRRALGLGIHMMRRAPH